MYLIMHTYKIRIILLCIYYIFIPYLRNTLISLSRESSLPFNAFLSIIFTAYISLGRSLLTANRTSEKAPLKTQNSCQVALQTINHQIFYGQACCSSDEVSDEIISTGPTNEKNKRLPRSHLQKMLFSFQTAK